MDIKRPFEVIKDNARPLAIAAVGLLGAAGLTGCESDKPQARTADVVATAPDGTTTTTASNPTTEEKIKNVFNSPNGVYECLDEGAASGVMNTVVLRDGTKTVGEISLKNLNVDGTVRLDLFRKWTDALSSPIVADLNDKNAVAHNLFASWCEEPAALIAAVVETANTPVNSGGKVLGNYVDWLGKYVGTKDEEVNDLVEKMRIPHKADTVTVGQERENIAKTNERIKLAEQMANAYLNMQNDGAFRNVEITKRLSLVSNAAVDTDTTPEFTHKPPYKGDAIGFSITTKGVNGENCVVHISSGFNVDDKSPVTFKHGNECVTPTTQAKTTPAPAPKGTTPRVSSKVDDAKVPGDPNVPADRDKGTNDTAGTGSAGQTPNNRGYTPTETTPSTQPTVTVVPTTQPGGAPTAPATTNRDSGPTGPAVKAPESPTEDRPETEPLPTRP